MASVDLKKTVWLIMVAPYASNVGPMRQSFRFGTFFISKLVPLMNLKDLIWCRLRPSFFNIFHQIRRTNNWIYKTKKSNRDRSSGPVAQQIEALSLNGSR